MRRGVFLALVGVLYAAIAGAVPVAADAAPFALPYNLTLQAGGRISGTFGGVPVLGTFERTATEDDVQRMTVEGVFTLTVDGKAFVMGVYQCVPVECALVAEEVLGRPQTFYISIRSMSGSIRGTLRQLYPSHAAWVSSVTEWGKLHLQTMPLSALIAAAARLRV